MFDNTNDTIEVDGNKVTVHARVVGDVKKAKKVVDSKGYGIINANNHPRLEYLTPDQLTPIDTQRDTKASWAESRLKDLKGLDMVAFGALSVGYDASNNKYWLYDGCGRDLLASLIDSNMPLPCLVYNLDQKQAAFYFSYNQDKGRRKLSKESIFVNSWFHGEPEAIKLGNILVNLGLKISANPDFNAPYGHISSTPITAVEISEKAITEVIGIAGQPTEAQSLALISQAKDMIFQAFSTPVDGVPRLERVNGELLWAIVYILRTYKDARVGDLNKVIQEYLNLQAQLTSQNELIKAIKARYSIPGMNKADELTKCNSYALVSEIRVSKPFKDHTHQSTLSKKFMLKDINPPIQLYKIGGNN